MRLTRMIGDQGEVCFHCGSWGLPWTQASTMDSTWRDFFQDEHGRLFCGLVCIDLQLYDDAKTPETEGELQVPVRPKGE